jgi:hypothetical protein
MPTPRVWWRTTPSADVTGGVDDLDAVMADFSEDAVLISPRHGVLRGAEIRTSCEHPSDLAGFDVIALFVHDEVAFFTSKTDAVAFGSDTFVLRRSKIAIQTVALPPALRAHHLPAIRTLLRVRSAVTEIDRRGAGITGW